MTGDGRTTRSNGHRLVWLDEGPNSSDPLYTIYTSNARLDDRLRAPKKRPTELRSLPTILAGGVGKKGKTNIKKIDYIYQDSLSK